MAKPTSIPDLRLREFLRPRPAACVRIPDGISFSDYDPSTAARSQPLCRMLSEQFRSGLSNPELVGSGDGLFDDDTSEFDYTAQYGFDRFDRIYAGIDSTSLGVMADASTLAPVEPAPATPAAPAQPLESQPVQSGNAL